MERTLEQVRANLNTTREQNSAALRAATRELKIEKVANSSRRFLSEALDRYNAASRARVYPGCDVDKQRDKIRMLRDALIQEMALTRYLAENIPGETMPFNDLPKSRREEYFRIVQEEVDANS